jgi:hypothetical protein
MPTYRYYGPRDTEPHEVVADGYERDDENGVTFHNVTAFDGDPRQPSSLMARVRGTVEVAD